ncbi:hypothetical protein TI39_contig4202g00064 [Zymoseptoria brevis]|uniref:Uncharacterized protein n=1 Tax=Zymoseptoria brevis TaxID=1047168 RepID=A0A0F4GAA2_9PEZI|nr:hypothetical protein TI39_contig4202g00064 [Zymoseptoria brevis]
MDTTKEWMWWQRGRGTDVPSELLARFRAVEMVLPHVLRARKQPGFSFDGMDIDDTAKTLRMRLERATTTELFRVTSLAWTTESFPRSPWLYAFHGMARDHRDAEIMLRDAELARMYANPPTGDKEKDNVHNLDMLPLDAWLLEDLVDMFDVDSATCMQWTPDWKFEWQTSSKAANHAERLIMQWDERWVDKLGWLGMEKELHEEEEGVSSAKDAQLFHDSDFCQPGWSRIDERDRRNPPTLADARDQHNLMFSIIHGMNVAFESIPNSILRHEPQNVLQKDPGAADDDPGWMQLLGWVCEFCARAEYYGCLSNVAGQVVHRLEEQPTIWRFAANHPWPCFLLAIKLRWKELYFDALRHLLSASSKELRMTIHLVAAKLRIDSWKVTCMHKTAISKEESMLQELCKRLRQLPLASPIKKADNTIGEEKDITTRNMERARYSARLIFGDWLSQQEAGQELPEWQISSTVPPTSFPVRHIVAKIQHYAHSRNPALLFGENAAQDHVNLIWDDETGGVAAQRINIKLRNLVCEAGDLIQRLFQETGVTDKNHTALTFRLNRWARGNALFGVYDKDAAFSHLGLDETDVPWKDEEAWTNMARISLQSDKEGLKSRLLALGMGSMQI